VTTVAGDGTGPSTTGAGDAGRCLVRLHGKGGGGGPTTTSGDVTELAPTGNADGWGGRQWLYFPDDEYVAATAVVQDATAGCDEVIVYGFSNGASFAAAMACRGESLGGALVGVVVDDPVTDHAVEGCAPADGVDVTLYATGALEETAPAGTDCGDIDWTCAGGSTIGIDAYAAALGVERRQSPHADHQPFGDAPEVTAWR
jgi:hypothetical protein